VQAARTGCITSARMLLDQGWGSIGTCDGAHDSDSSRSWGCHMRAALYLLSWV
jgi:hypothetical protein